MHVSLSLATFPIVCLRMSLFSHGAQLLLAFLALIHSAYSESRSNASPIVALDDYLMAGDLNNDFILCRILNGGM